MCEISVLDQDSKFAAVVTATSYDNPLSDIRALENKLAHKLDAIISAEVLFDLLCSSGTEWNRFIAMKMNEGKLIVNSARVVECKNLPNTLVTAQSKFFRDNPQFLSASILTDQQIAEALSNF